MKNDKILAYDCETTGFSSSKNGMHEISCISLINGVETGRISLHMKPQEDCEYREETMTFLKISKEEILCYQPMEEAFIQFKELIDSMMDVNMDKIMLCGHNIKSFDNRFLKAWFLNNDNEDFYHYFHDECIDTLSMAKKHFKNSLKKPDDFKLPTVAKFLGFNVDENNLHTAEYDCDLSLFIYNKLKGLRPLNDNSF